MNKFTHVVQIYASLKKWQSAVRTAGIITVLLAAVGFYALPPNTGSPLLANIAGTLLGHAAAAQQQYYYYGADLSKMTTATGVNSNNPAVVAANAPWPQNAKNYCFLAATQAVVNYNDATHGTALRYPTASTQGPVSGSPTDETSGQILSDLDTALIPDGGPLSVTGSGANRRPFTLANIAYDFGGDPRAIAVGSDYELTQDGFGNDALYHQHIYHTSAGPATAAIAKAVAAYQKPAIVIVNHGEHAVVVAGVWASSNPATNANAQINALAVYNPWNQQWGAYLSKSYYAKVSYTNWVNASNLPSPYGGTNSWYKLPYQSNNNIDPDPSIGIYQAGSGTANPTAHHWITNFVTIQYDNHATSADTAYDENDNPMTQP
jgi:hypothetical protein